MKRATALVAPHEAAARVPRSIEKGGIWIDTVHAFVGRLMHGLGIIQNYLLLRQ